MLPSVQELLAFHNLPPHTPDAATIHARDPRQRPGRKAGVRDRYSAPPGARQFRCGVHSCAATFKRPEHLKRHMLTHTQSRPYCCSVRGCGKRFGRRDNYVTHTRKHEAASSSPPSPSSSASPPATTARAATPLEPLDLLAYASLRADMPPPSPAADVPSPPADNAPSPSPQAAADASSPPPADPAAPDPAKPFACSLCDSRFGRMEHVKRHQLVHTGERQHECPVCCKPFARKDNMVQHMRSHQRQGETASDGAAAAAVGGKEEEEEEEPTMNGAGMRRGSSLHRHMTVTPFLNKLYSMVDDGASDGLIRWSAEGNSFVVVRHEDFAKEVLPRFFKHSNFSSFVRQLNMYGFHKVPHLQQGGLIADSPEAESWEFSNDNFCRGQPDLLHFIQRKKGNRDAAAAAAAAASAADADEDAQALHDADTAAAAADDTTTAGLGASASALAADQQQQQQQQQQQHKQEETQLQPVQSGGGGASAPESAGTKARASRVPPISLPRILKEIQSIRDHQMTISADIKRLQEENRSMWIQARETEQRYIKHQETIDKILRFLATVFSNDARHSEIRPPLRRLISHTAKSDRTDAGGGGSGGGASGDGPYSAAPWASSVFEEMDFPDTLADHPARPPDKRQRTGRSPQPARAYEPAVMGAAPGIGDSGCGGDGRRAADARQKHQQSTALTRVQPRNVFGAGPQYAPAGAPPSPTASASASASDTTTASRLDSQSEDIDRLSQKIDVLGRTINDMVWRLGPMLAPQAPLAPPQQQPPPPPMTMADGLVVPGIVGPPATPQSMLGDAAGSLASILPVISAADLGALFSDASMAPPPLAAGAGSGAELVPFVGAPHVAAPVPVPALDAGLDVPLSLPQDPAQLTPSASEAVDVERLLKLFNDSQDIQHSDAAAAAAAASAAAAAASDPLFSDFIDDDGSVAAATAAAAAAAAAQEGLPAAEDATTEGQV
ncbi:Heat shock transcription factor [Coemansia javaensis]|uniref:Heat shock transcription factor n=1 Tax=Coemansia javaensis TaxID=2761396 RepID=A0A9W8LH08_9FUNG|nr:Heat shock transcription factor [Coemansia javaensis]